MTWFVIQREGQPLRQVSSLDGEDVEGAAVTQVDRAGNLAFEILEDGGWTDDMPRITEALCLSIDEERERRQAELLTPGTAKAIVYAQKTREAAIFAMLPPGLTLDAGQFPAAAAEAQASGRTLLDVLESIRAAAESVNAELYRLDALATTAKAAVREAVTAADAAAAAEIDWG